MSKEILLALLEASFKERLGSLEKRVDREMEDLTMLKGYVNKIEKHTTSCNSLTTEIIAKMKEKKEAEAKRKLERSQRVATEGRANRGKSVPALSNKISRHKTTSSLLTSSTIDMNHQNEMRKIQSSGDMMRTAAQMAKDKQNNIEMTPLKIRAKTVFKTSNSKLVSSETTPRKRNNDKDELLLKVKESSKKTNKELEGDKEIDKEKGKRKGNEKRSIGSSSKKFQPKKEATTESKGKRSEKKQNHNEETSKELSEKKDEIPGEKSLTTDKDKEAKEELPHEAISKEENPPIVNQNDNSEPSPSPLTLIPNEKSNNLQILIVNWGTLSKFLTHEDRNTYGTLGKASMKSYLFSAKTELQIELTSLETSLNEIRQKFSSIDLTKQLPPFSFGKGGSKAVGLLNDELYYNLFIKESIPQKDIIVVYRIFFQLCNKEKDILNTKNDSQFWSKTCKFFVEKSNKTVGALVDELTKSLDFSNENILILKQLCKDYITKLTPLHYSTLCPTTGLFIFIVKEALEYCGILPDKKINPVRVYKNLTFFIKTAKEKIMKIEAALS